MYLELFYILAAFLFLLYYPGFGITRLIIPDRFRECELLVIPFVGLSVILSSAHIFSFLGIGSSVFTWLIIVLITPLNVYALRKKGLPNLNIEEMLPVFLISIAVFIVGMLPLFYEGYLTAVGTNGDAAHYVSVADHFLTNGIAPPKGKGLWHTNLIHHLLTDTVSRLGPMYFQSMVGAVTGLEGYKHFTVIMSLFRSLLLFSAYVFIKTEGLLSKKGSLFAIGMLGINSFLYWLVIDGFLAQIMMMSVLPLAMTASFRMLTDKSHSGLVFSAVISSAILMTSPESIILVLGPMFIFIVINVIKREFLLNDVIRIVTLLALLLAVVNLIPLKASFEWGYNLITTGLEKGFQTANPGNVGYFIPLTQVFSFTPPYHPLYREIVNNPAYTTPSYFVYYYSSYIAVFVGLLLIIYSIFKIEVRKRIVLVSLVGPYLIMELYFRFSFPYGYFKVTSSTQFITVILLTAGLWTVFSSRLPSILKGATMMVAALFVLLSLISSYLLFDMVLNDNNEEWITINRELIALKEVQKDIGSGEIVLIEERLGRGNKYYWINYLMQDREVVTRKAILGTEIFTDKEYNFSYVIDGGYKYQKYIDKGWNTVLETSRYVLLEKNKQ